MLRSTTALVAVVMLAAPTRARATDYVIDSGNSPYAGPLALGNGDNVTVTNSGSITGGGSGLSISGSVTAGSIDNNGIISGNSDGIYVQNGSNISGGITNESGGTITGSTGIQVSNGQISGGIPMTSKWKPFCNRFPPRPTRNWRRL